MGYPQNIDSICLVGALLIFLNKKPDRRPGFPFFLSIFRIAGLGYLFGRLMSLILLGMQAFLT
jgi:hypothetical protein